MKRKEGIEVDGDLASDWLGQNMNDNVEDSLTIEAEERRSVTAWRFSTAKPGELKALLKANEELRVEQSSHCSGDPARRCGLAQIFMLPALHKRLEHGNFDAFLVLFRIPPVNGKPNCYRRIGLVEWINGKKTWGDKIRGRIEPVREEFWIF